ncbi:MAG: hypothetical protein J7513_16730 [Solirubrobacteraceae bacterium]|nr:hypothetical protein [Solirubrobacteraceae bacterium]
MSRLPRLRLLLLALCAMFAAAVPSASAANFIVEDWHGSGGLAWQQGTATDFIGWESTSSDGTFNFAKADLSGRRSLFAEAQFLPQQLPGTGEWRFPAPGTSTITKAEYGAAVFTKEGCLNEGMRLANGTWQPTRNARLGDAAAASVHPTACGANSTVTGAPVTTKDGATAVTITGAPGRQTFCSTAGCGLAGSPTGNQAVFGAERIKQGRPGFGVVLPGARLTLTDYDAPRLTAGTNSHPRWVRSALGTVTVTATDTGLGVKSTTVTHAALAGNATATQTHPCSGDRTDRCPATWNTARREWTTTWPYDTDQMPEGVQPYGVATQDVVENRTPASGDDRTPVPPSKIDRSDPTDITGTGQIPALDGKWFLGNDTRTITASAHDTYSGVERLQIETTDGEVLDSATFDCSDDQCPRDITETLAVDTTKLPEGDTVVRLRATDLVGNTAVGRTWTLRIDRSDPTDIAGTGSLPDSDGVWTLGNDTRSVHATAHDQYSGVKRLELETAAGDLIERKTFACSDGQCEHEEAAILSLDLNTLPEGDTRVRLRATDLLDHTAVGPVWTLRVDRSDPSTPVAISGPLRALQDAYTQGRDPVSLTVGASDAYSGVARIEVRADGAAIADHAPSCPSGQCPREAERDVAVALAGLSEGRHTFAVDVVDLVGHRRSSEQWTVAIDRTAPPELSDVRIVGFDADTGDVQVRWDEPVDPDLADGSPGSGASSVAVEVWRDGHRVDASIDDDGVDLAGLGRGTLELRFTLSDAIGNQRSFTRAFTLDQPVLDDPLIDDAAADALIDEHPDWSRPTALEYVRTQSEVMTAADDAFYDNLEPRLDHPIGSTFFDDSVRKAVFTVASTSDATTARAALAAAGLAADAIVRVRAASSGQLMQAYDATDARIAQILGDTPYDLALDQAEEALNVTVDPSASSAEVQAVRAVDSSGLALHVTQSATSVEWSADGCGLREGFGHCTGAGRGGVTIFKYQAGAGPVCTLAFRLSGGFGVTAGHCWHGREGEQIGLLDPDGQHRRLLGTASDANWGFGGPVPVTDAAKRAAANGDTGLISLSPSADMRSRIWVRKAPASSASHPRQSTSYVIRGSQRNMQNAVVCFSGAVSGTRCGKVSAVGVSVLSHGTHKVTHLAAARVVSQPGDSGAPFFKAHRAFGVLSGGKNGATAYTGAKTVESTWGGTIG